MAGNYAPNYYGGGGGSSGAVANVPTEGAKANTIQLPLVVGDDYLAANGRFLSWTVSIPTGTTVAASSAKLRFVQASGSCDPFEIEITGTIAAGSVGFAVMSFSMTDTQTATIPPGEYFWFVEWIGDAGEVITKVYNNQLVFWKSKAAA